MASAAPLAKINRTLLVRPPHCSRIRWYRGTIASGSKLYSEAHMETETIASAPLRRWPFFLVGVLLFVLGPVIYFVRFRSEVLETPWYVPVLATVGVFFLLLSLRQRRGLAR